MFDGMHSEFTQLDQAIPSPYGMPAMEMGCHPRCTTFVHFRLGMLRGYNWLIFSRHDTTLYPNHASFSLTCAALATKRRLDQRRNSYSIGTWLFALYVLLIRDQGFANMRLYRN